MKLALCSDKRWFAKVNYIIFGNIINDYLCNIIENVHWSNNNIRNINNFS